MAEAEHLVLVEDRRDVLEGRVRWLEGSEHVVLAALDFPDALDYAAWEPVTVAVLDAHDGAPRAGAERPVRLLGPLVARRIRRVRKKGEARIVVVSSWHASVVLEQMLWEVGADEVFDPWEVQDRYAFLDLVAGQRQGKPVGRVASQDLAREIRAHLPSTVELTFQRDRVPRLVAALDLAAAAPPAVRRRLLELENSVRPDERNRDRGAYDELAEGLTHALLLSPSHTRRSSGRPLLRRVMAVLRGETPPP